MFLVPIQHDNYGVNNFFLNRYIYVYDNKDLISDYVQNKRLLFIIDTCQFKLIFRFIEIKEKTYSHTDNRLNSRSIFYAGPRGSIRNGFKVKLRCESFEIKFTMYMTCNICQFWCKDLSKNDKYFKHMKDYYFVIKNTLDPGSLHAYYTNKSKSYVNTTLV